MPYWTGWRDAKGGSRATPLDRDQTLGAIPAARAAGAINTASLVPAFQRGWMGVVRERMGIAIRPLNDHVPRIHDGLGARFESQREQRRVVQRLLQHTAHPEVAHLRQRQTVSCASAVR